MSGNSLTINYFQGQKEMSKNTKGRKVKNQSQQLEMADIQPKITAIQLLSGKKVIVSLFYNLLSRMNP